MKTAPDCRHAGRDRKASSSWLRNRSCIVCLTYTDPRGKTAGLEKYLADQTVLLQARGVSTVCLFPFPTRRSRWLNRRLSSYWGVVADGVLQGFYRIDGVKGFLAQLSHSGISLKEIQLHHFLNSDLALVERLLREVPAPVRLILHDFYTVCPQRFLLRNNCEHCGEAPPSAEKCANCTRWTPGYHEAIGRVLNAARGRLTVVAPSETARRIWTNAFPEHAPRTVVVPHLVPAGETAAPDAGRRPDEPLRLAFVGAPMSHKGWSVFLRLVDERSRQGRDYEFYHFGRLAPAGSGVIHVPVSFVRDGPGAMTEALRRARVDIVLLWSTCPETYSYTLVETRMADAMVLTNPDSGNIADTVRREEAGVVVPDAEELLRYLSDRPRIRRDLEAFRRRHARRPDRMAVNPAIADEIAARPAPGLAPEGGSARPSRVVGALYRLKQWKAALKRESA